jgi:hypothetical protein
MTTSYPINARQVIHDTLARIVPAREAAENGEVGLAVTILRELEDDVAGWMARKERRAASRRSGAQVRKPVEPVDGREGSLRVEDVWQRIDPQGLLRVRQCLAEALGLEEAA